MEVAYLTAFSALAGSIIGGLTTGLTSLISLRSQAHAGRLASEILRRQDLFRDFIVAASRAYGDALMKDEPQIQELVSLYAMISRMRVLCSQEIVSCADRVMDNIVDTYFGPNRTVRELHDFVKSGAGINPLKEFSEAAREELRAFDL